MRDFIDDALNEWYEEVFFKDVFPRMMLINDTEFNQIFRTPNGNLRRSLIKTKTIEGQRMLHYYRKVLLIRTPDIKKGTMVII